MSLCRTCRVTDSNTNSRTIHPCGRSARGHEPLRRPRHVRLNAGALLKSIELRLPAPLLASLLNKCSLLRCTSNHHRQSCAKHQPNVSWAVLRSSPTGRKPNLKNRLPSLRRQDRALWQVPACVIREMENGLRPCIYLDTYTEHRCTAWQDPAAHSQLPYT